MKHLIIILILTSVLFVSCQKEENEITFQETGIVVDYTGAGNCNFVIELDKGGCIQPLYYPAGFTFSNGQRVFIEYVELNDVIPGCDQGTASEIKYAEELSCAPFVDLYSNNYDSLAHDPVFIHEAFVDGECLDIKLSYSGGCKEHQINLARIHPETASSSTAATFEIRHNANNDLCEAHFTQELRFSLTPLILEGKTEFTLTTRLPNGEVYNKTFDLNLDK